MGLFNFGGRKNELLSILKRIKRSYMDLLRTKNTRSVQNTIKVIISFIDDMIRIINDYYLYDFKKSNQRAVFQRRVRQTDTHITSIIAYANKCGLNGRKIDRFWRGKNIGRIDAAKMDERDVRTFVNSVRYLLDYLYKSLKKL